MTYFFAQIEGLRVRMSCPGLTDIMTCMDRHWLNMVERWFRDLMDKQIRRGVFKSAAELVATIQAYIQRHNQNPKAFVWTAKAEDIIAKYRRAKAVLDKLQTA